MAPTQPQSQQQLRQAVLDEPQKLSQHLFNFNKHAIAAKMLAIGLTEGFVTYNGGGDEGRLEETFFQPQSSPDPTTQVEQAVLRYRWDPETSLGGNEIQFVSLSLFQAIEDLCEAAIELAGHSGYENGTGGEGTFTFIAQGLLARLEHHDHYTESADSVHEL